MNIVILRGKVADSPVLRNTSVGDILSIKVVTERRGKDGPVKNYHMVSVFGDRVAGLASMTPGTNVFVQGSIHTRSYTDGAGTKKWFTEVSVRGDGEFTVLDHAPGHDRPRPEGPTEPPDDEIPF